MKIIAFLTLFVSFNSFGQDKNISTKEIYGLFKRSIYQPEKKAIRTVSNEWVTCNQDSAFYKKDTLKIYSYSYYYKLGVHSTNCCEQIGWTFYKKDKFVLSKLHFCNEPPVATITKRNDFFMIKLFRKNKIVFLQTFSQQKLIDNFKILNVYEEKNENAIANTIILKRENQ